MKYTDERFRELCKEFMDNESRIMDWKAGEYTEGIDRLQNFREIAAFEGRKMSQVALSYMLKHVQSINIAVRTGNYQWEWETEGGEGLMQRFSDVRNYLLLLAACLDEESEGKE